MNVKKLFLIVGLVMGTVACDQQPTGQNADVTLKMGSYTSAQFRWFDLMIPRAHAAVSSLKFCFKRLRIKPVDEGTPDPATAIDNVDFDLGELDIANSGTVLATLTMPEGVYRRVEFDLENHCVGGKSLQLTNSNGTYSTNERITIKFSGNFTAYDVRVLDLGVQSIIDSLNSYSGVGSLKDAAEAASGSF